MAQLRRGNDRCDRRPSGDCERAICCFAKALLNLHGKAKRFQVRKRSANDPSLELGRL